MSDILDIKSITEVDAVYHTKLKNMPDELKHKVSCLTPMQRKYAEYRSKGMKQADAAKRAGSSAKDRAALTRTGYNWEQVDGMKEYITFLYQKRAEAALLDEVEILDRVRTAIERSMDIDRPDWAIKGIELMGSMIGAFHKSPIKQQGKQQDTEQKGTNAFKNEGEEISNDQRLKDIQNLMQSIQKSKIYKDTP